MRLAVLVLLGACGFAPTSGSDMPAGTAADAPLGLDALQSARCPADFVPVAGAPSLYKIYSYSADVTADARQPFDASVATCIAQGAHLAIVETPEEATALSTVIVADPSFQFYAEGVTDAAVEGTWLTVLGGPATYLPWAGGQPDGAGGGDGDCGIINYSGQLYDYYCDLAHPYAFACECEP
jgi:lectin-like protein